MTIRGNNISNTLGLIIFFHVFFLSFKVPLQILKFYISFVNIEKKDKHLSKLPLNYWKLKSILCHLKSSIYKLAVDVELFCFENVKDDNKFSLIFHFINNLSLYNCLPVNIVNVFLLLYDVNICKRTTENTILSMHGHLYDVSFTD